VKFTQYIFSILTTFLLCSGCTSYHWLKRPGAAGIIVDSQTSKPIDGALIELSRDPKLYGSWYAGDGRGLHAASTLSAVDGTFSIPPLQKRGVIATWTPNDGVFYLLSVRRDGYLSYTNTFWYFSGDYPSGRYKGAPVVGPSTNFNKITLERLSK
jgi:hypothetical protein